MTPLGLGAALSEFEIPDETATRRLGAQVANLVRSGGFIGLIGNLGAGKTTLTQGLVAELGGPEKASSPTYTLLNEYPTSPPVHHFDLYRLSDVDELEGIGYWDYVEDPSAIVVVEWLDRVPGAWPGEGIVIELIHRDGHRAARVWATSRWEPTMSKLP